MIYDENDTMIRLGNESYSQISIDGQKGIYDVLNAHHNHKEIGLVQMATDLYMLGFINAKEELYVNQRTCV